MSTHFINKNLQKFIGNASVAENVRTALQGLQGGASLVLHGPNGCGKSTLCFHLAREILSDWNNTQIPEHRILNLTHSDFFFLNSDSDGKNIISIDDVRKLRDFLRYTAAEGSNKVVIIDKIDHATRSAANGLLKILEEPPKNTFILIVADQLGTILPTIRSRCLKFRMKKLQFAEFNELQYLANDDLYTTTSGSITMAALFADEELGKINQLLLKTLFNKNNKIAEVEQIADAMNDYRAWELFKKTVFSQIFSKIKQNLHDPSLEKKLQYLDKIKQQFANVDIYHLDKKSIVYSVLCQ